MSYERFMPQKAKEVENEIWPKRERIFIKPRTVLPRD